MKSIGVEDNYSSLQKYTSALVLEMEQESQNRTDCTRFQDLLTPLDCHSEKKKKKCYYRKQQKHTYIARLYKQVHQFV